MLRTSSSRSLTLLATVPYNQIIDPVKRKQLDGAPNKAGYRSIYKGLGRALVKEGVFTSSYVLLNSYFGTLYSSQRVYIQRNLVARIFPKETDETWNRYTDTTISALKATSAGFVCTFLAQPIEMAGRNIPVRMQATSTLKKAVRKGCYNAVNTLILNYLTSTAHIFKRHNEEPIPKKT